MTDRFRRSTLAPQPAHSKRRPTPELVSPPGYSATQPSPFLASQAILAPSFRLPPRPFRWGGEKRWILTFLHRATARLTRYILRPHGVVSSLLEGAARNQCGLRRRASRDPMARRPSFLPGTLHASGDQNAPSPPFIAAARAIRTTTPPVGHMSRSSGLASRTDYHVITIVWRLCLRTLPGCRPHTVAHLV
jgi:hypothetical protein